MNRQILPEAYFDSLSIAHKLDNFLDGFEQREIHLFAYFSAILFYYNGNPVNDWKYKFIIGKDKYPHSKELDDAINKNILSGYFEETSNFMIITGRGTDEYNKFKVFGSNKKREKYIDAACSTSVLIPYKETIKALLNDPNIIKASQINNQDWIAYSNNKLKEITNALGAPADELLIPAVSWIEYLLKNELKD
ncbi:MAG: hypothetical protein GXO49_01525 [Chlorobi bacterium]|nr:hypothetical protein [Chlorobiota bacterium]